MSETSVARIAEISAKSTDGFEDAIRTGLERAQKTTAQCNFGLDHKSSA